MGKGNPQAETETVRIGGLPIGPGARIGPYVYERRIGSGGMAWVLLARDPEGRPVALKVLRGSRLEKGHDRFRREFRSLTRIHHPNVIRVEALGDLYGHPYIAMEYVEGTDLHRTIRSMRDWDLSRRWDRCGRILVDMCRALAHIHRRGLVHRDLKPSNILIDGHGRCKLTDFGIVKDLDPSADPNVSNTLVGTWAYASPEQIGGHPFDHRSDLYSLGVILFTMLTGRRPFVARDMAGYLELHRDHPPPRASSLLPSVPEHLDRICHRLMAKSPRERFQSAQEILYGLEQTDTPRPRSSLSPSWEPPVVGQAAARERLAEAIHRLTRGEGAFVLIEGAAGSGRTRLLEVAREQCLNLGFPFYHCRDRVEEGLFGSLRRLTAELLRDLESPPSAELTELMEALHQGTEDGGYWGDLRYRLYDAVKAAMNRALEAGPRVIAIDDLHRAGEPSRGLLSYLSRTVVAEGQPLLMVATVDSDDDSQALHALADPSRWGVEPVRIRLEPLSAEDILELVTELLGDAQGTRALAERLHRESEGNPLFLVQFLQTLSSRGFIVEGPGGLALAIDTDEVRSGHLEIPPKIRDVLNRRLHSIEGEARQLLEVLAVNGRETDLDVLIDVLLDVVQTDEDRVLRQIDSLVKAGIVEEHGDGSRVHVAFTHGKFGDILYRDMSPDRRLVLHRKLAAVYSVRSSGSALAAQVIGEHYRRAGEAVRAFEYLTLAARRLHDRALPTQAWAAAERASAARELAREELDTESFARIHLTLLRVQGDILYGKGEWEQAREKQREAMALAESYGPEEDLRRIRLDLARSEGRLGNDNRSTHLASVVLGQAREAGDRAHVADALQVMAAQAWKRGDLETCERLATQGLVQAVGPRLEGSRAELLLAVTAVQASMGHLESAVQALSEAEAIFGRLGLKRSRSLALANLAEFHTWRGDLGRALEYARRTRALSREVLYRVGQGVGARAEGVVLLEAAQPEPARRALLRALEILGPLRITQEVVATRYALGTLELHHGTLRRARHHLAVALGQARQQDPEGYQPLVEATLAQVYHLSGDRFQAEQGLGKILAEWSDAAPGSGARRIPLFRHVQCLVVVAGAAARLGDRRRAERVARQALVLARQHGARVWALDALAVLVGVVDDEEERTRFRQQYRAARAELVSILPEELGRTLEHRPALEAFIRGDA